jgi:hypothetical protein
MPLAGALFAKELIRELYDQAIKALWNSLKEKNQPRVAYWLERIEHYVDEVEKIDNEIEKLKAAEFETLAAHMTPKTGLQK